MLTFVTIIHLFIALVLIVFVLLQDSKGGGAAGVFGGGGGSNTLFGATGGADFLTKVTRYTAIGFAITSLLLAYWTSKPQTSLMDDYVPPAATESAPAAAPTEAAPAETAPVNSAPATPAPAEPAK
ncbi:MAG: preprotein translocase subunit SecG [Bdellovibrionales bacterium]|nr:preprotein translocase subunit SecG [Bdellovibrionales bacterium]